MKKINRCILIIMFLTMLSTLCFGITAFADEYGTITKYSERVIPDGEGAAIQVEVEGTTDDTGILYVPFYKDAELESVSPIEGKLADSQGVEKIIGKLEYMAYKFDSSNSKVKMSFIYKKKNLYEGKKSKQKESYPWGIKTISYSFKNTTPIDIDNYSVKIFFPQDLELYNMVSPAYDDLDEYNVGVENNLKYVEVPISSLSSQDTSKISINIYKQSTKAKILAWVICVALSVFFLYKRKDEFKKDKLAKA